MQDIINQVKDLYEKLIVRSKKLDEDKSALNDKRIKVNGDAKANEQLLKELEKREKKIKTIEDVVKLKDEVADAYRTLTSDKKLLKKEREDLKILVEKVQEDIKAERETVSAQRLKVEKKEADLEEERKKYKKQALAQITKSLEEGIK